MTQAVLYTGTFDPFHLGHLRQLERTYKAMPFEKAVIALIKSNPKKPHATSWEDRKKLIELRLADLSLPFQIHVEPIEYVQPDSLRRFVKNHLTGYRVIRTVASDSIVEFVTDTDHGFIEALTMFSYAIVVRPLANEEMLNNTLAALPEVLKQQFKFKIVHIQTEDDISGTNIRKNPIKAFQLGYITESQKDYILEKQLFNV